MSVLTTFPRISRSRWTEPLVTAVGAVVLGLGFMAAHHSRPAPAVSTSPSPTHVVASASAPDLRTLIAFSTKQRIRLGLRHHPKLPSGRLYHIRWGDTLWGLAHKFHVSMKDLEEANHMRVPDLVAGSYLVVPELYHVQPGETLAAVAHRLDVPLLLLWQTNRLEADKLRPGQVLVVPYLGHIPHSRYAAPARLAAAAVPAQPSRGLDTLSVTLSPQDMMTIAHLVAAEAGDQPFLGQVAVAAVVLNRLKTPGFPKTVDGVVFSPGQFETVAAGTFWNRPSPLAMMAVKAAASGWDPTNGALYFYNPTLPHVAWMNSLPSCTTIGSQVFCH